MFKKVCLFSGNANPHLAATIGQYLETPLGKCKVTRFSDGESFVEIGENVRGVDAFVIQSTSSPTNDSVMELLIMTDALRRAVRRLDHGGHPVLRLRASGSQSGPAHAHHGQARRRSAPVAGVNRVVSVDLHAGQIQGFFNIPFDHLYALPVFLEDYLRKQFDSSARCSSRPTRAASSGRGPIRSGSTRRWRSSTSAASEPTWSDVVNIIGEVKGKDCIIIDDIIDTAGTLLRRRACACPTRAPKRSWPAPPTACFRAPPCSASRSRRCRSHRHRFDPAFGLGQELPEDQQLSIARLLGEAIKRIHSSDSVSSLFA